MRIKKYDEFKDILNEKQINDLKDLYKYKLSSDINYINYLQDINEFLNNLYPLKEEAIHERQKIENFIKELKKNKINSKEKNENDEIGIKKRDIQNNILNKYKYLVDKYLEYTKSKLFLAAFLNNNNDLEKLEKIKNKFDNFILQLFRDEILKIEFSGNEFFEKLQKIQDEENLKAELNKMHSIFLKIVNIKNSNFRGEGSNIINQTIDKIKIYKEFCFKSKLIQGIKIFISSLNNSVHKDKEDYQDLEKLSNDVNGENKRGFLENLNQFFQKLNIDINRINIKENNSINFLNFLTKYPESLNFLNNMNEESYESLNKIITDPNYNEYIVITDLLKIKNYFFKKLKNKTSISEIIKLFLNLPEKDEKLSEDIKNFEKNYPDLEKFSKKEEGKSINFKDLLNELNNSIFYIKFNEKNNIYELKNIISNENEKEIIDDYNEIIIGKSFFTMIHAKNDEDLYKKIKTILENDNYIKEYISLLNNKRNIFDSKKKEIKLRIKNNEIHNIEENESIRQLIKLFKDKEKNEKQILIEYYKKNDYLTLFPSLYLKHLYSLIKEKEENIIRKIFSPFFNYLINYYELQIIDKNKEIKIVPEKGTFEDKLNLISEYLEKLFNFFEIWKKYLKITKLRKNIILNMIPIIFILKVLMAMNMKKIS